ncbi:MAG: sulfotransferase family protein [Nitrosospira sp.]|nr:sulfotransferase family protein [Nitrosospira sp.]
MIICDDKQFAFIHIPKCGGSTVRIAIAKFDSTHGRFSSTNAHYTLSALRDGFPSEFSHVKQYHSFAICRDPIRRFPSSLHQYLLENKQLYTHKLTERELRSEIDQIITKLSGVSELLGPELIHFEKQVNYVDLDGERIVKSIYAIDDMSRMMKDMGEYLGENLVFRIPANHRVENRSHIIWWILHNLQFMDKGIFLKLRGYLPEAAKKVMRKIVYIPAQPQHSMKPFESAYVRDFITSHYQGDVALFHDRHQPDPNAGMDLRARLPRG